MKNRFDDAWEAFVARDRALKAPDDLERRVLDAVIASQDAVPEPGLILPLATYAIAAGAVAAIMTFSDDRALHSPAPPLHPTTLENAWRGPRLAARTFAVAPLPAAIPAQPARVLPPADAPSGAVLADWMAVYQDLPIILMLDAAESAAAEPLQLVRLRLSMDALHALGVATLEPHTGLVDVDLLFGEDGLPKTIRQVRLAQEEP